MEIFDYSTKRKFVIDGENKENVQKIFFDPENGQITIFYEGLEKLPNYTNTDLNLYELDENDNLIKSCYLKNLKLIHSTNILMKYSYNKLEINYEA